MFVLEQKRVRENLKLFFQIMKGTSRVTSGKLHPKAELSNIGGPGLRA